MNKEPISKEYHEARIAELKYLQDTEIESQKDSKLAIAAFFAATTTLIILGLNAETIKSGWLIILWVLFTTCVIALNIRIKFKKDIKIKRNYKALKELSKK